MAGQIGATPLVTERQIELQAKCEEQQIRAAVHAEEAGDIVSYSKSVKESNLYRRSGTRLRNLASFIANKHNALRGMIQNHPARTGVALTIAAIGAAVAAIGVLVVSWPAVAAFVTAGIVGAAAFYTAGAVFHNQFGVNSKQAVTSELLERRSVSEIEQRIEKTTARLSSLEQKAESNQDKKKRCEASFKKHQSGYIEKGKQYVGRYGCKPENYLSAQGLFVDDERVVWDAREAEPGHSTMSEAEELQAFKDLKKDYHETRRTMRKAAVGYADAVREELCIESEQKALQGQLETLQDGLQRKTGIRIDPSLMKSFQKVVTDAQAHSRGQQRVRAHAQTGHRTPQLQAVDSNDALLAGESMEQRQSVSINQLFGDSSSSSGIFGDELEGQPKARRDSFSFDTLLTSDKGAAAAE